MTHYNQVRTLNRSVESNSSTAISGRDFGDAKKGAQGGNVITLKRTSFSARERAFTSGLTSLSVNQQTHQSLF